MPLFRNAKLRPKSTLQSAFGFRHGKTQQKSQGFMGGSFNTRDFFHGMSTMFFKSIKWINAGIYYFVGNCVCCAICHVGLIAERWFFFAQVNHPQNLYYQTIL